MTMLQRQAGHEACSVHIQEYLDWDGERYRPLGYDFIGFREAEKSRWAYFMDKTREKWGADLPKNGRRPVTYQHFVISPDPQDNISLIDLMALARDWTEEFFGSDYGTGRLGQYQAVIVPHDDGGTGVLHAHIIVNSVKLDPEGGKLHISSQENDMLWDRLQEMSKDRGLSALEAAKEWRAQARANDAEIGREVKKDRYMTKTERELERAGRWSWKADLCNMVTVARRTSQDEEGFLESLQKFGVGVTRKVSFDIEISGEVRGREAFKALVLAGTGANEATVLVAGKRVSAKDADEALARGGDVRLELRRTDGGEIGLDTDMLDGAGIAAKAVGDDYVYSHPSKNQRWTSSGYRLGKAYSRERVLKGISSDRRIGRPRKNEVREQVEKFVLKDWLATGERAAIVNQGVKIKDVAFTLYTNDRYGIRCMADYDRAIAYIDRRIELIESVRGDSASDRQRRADVVHAKEIAKQGDFFLRTKDEKPAPQYGGIYADGTSPSPFYSRRKGRAGVYREAQRSHSSSISESRGGEARSSGRSR